MKYLYKGMAMPGWGDVSGSVLLGWHEKVCVLFLGVCERADVYALWIVMQLTEIAGVGCIVRVMTDRRNV